MNPLVLRQPMILTFLLHKSAASGQMYSNSLSTFKLKSLLSIIFKTAKLDLWLLRDSHSNGTHVFWDTLYMGYFNKKTQVKTMPA